MQFDKNINLCGVFIECIKKVNKNLNCVIIIEVEKKKKKKIL